MTGFPPTRAAALEKLNAFMPLAGETYARKRNFDLPGHPFVSGLSPYLRHRRLTEPEVLATVASHHAASAAEKFVQEVCWRTYWKGVLERRPGLWQQYRAGLRAAVNRVQTEGGLRRDWEAACTGRTGIDCFDHWANELAETGYLHNHARMWFASIWIFTLRLPWELGADFFLRHLLDGDPASNTLSWRWVGGLQTPGKTYLARADNIARYTEGRFRPKGLATVAPPLDGPPMPPAQPAPIGDPAPGTGRWGLLVTEEDLHPDRLVSRAPSAMALFAVDAARIEVRYAPQVIDFKKGLMADCARPLGIGGGDALPDTAAIVAWADAADLACVVTPHVPVGPTADRLAGLATALSDKGIRLARVQRPYDAAAWPHAGAGFFRFREAIPKLVKRACTDAPAGPLFARESDR